MDPTRLYVAIHAYVSFGASIVCAFLAKRSPFPDSHHTTMPSDIESTEPERVLRSLSQFQLTGDRPPPQNATLFALVYYPVLDAFERANMTPTTAWCLNVGVPFFFAWAGLAEFVAAATSPPLAAILVLAQAIALGALTPCAPTVRLAYRVLVATHMTTLLVAGPSLAVAALLAFIHAHTRLVWTSEIKTSI